MTKKEAINRGINLIQDLNDIIAKGPSSESELRMLPLNYAIETISKLVVLANLATEQCEHISSGPRLFLPAGKTEVKDATFIDTTCLRCGKPLKATGWELK